MKQRSRVLVIMTMTILMALAGCDEEDKRLAEMAQQTLNEQARQNERLAEQHANLVDASNKLVDAESQARRDMLAAQAELDRQRDHLEQDRKTIAQQRHRDPIIAQSITGFGVTIACLFPLFLAAYVLRLVSQAPANAEAVNELLITEMVTKRPKLLLPPTDHRRLLESGRRAAVDKPDGDPPF